MAKTTEESWWGVDLDGTLAQYDGWISESHIGEPVPEMLFRVRKWLADGRKVKIFTARVCEGPGRNPDFARHCIVQWCKKHLGTPLEVTNVKDYAMVELWDDRAVRVRENKGEPCCENHRRL